MPVIGGAPLTGPMLGPTTTGGGGGRGGTVWQSYPWTRVVEGGGNAGAQLAGLGGIDFNALLQMLRQARQVKRPPTHIGKADLHGQFMQSMRDKDELARIQAMTQPGPTKQTYVGNSPGFLELDPFAMNAYQRQAFLPQGANFYGPTGNEAASIGRAEDRQALAAQPLWQLSQWAAANQLINSANQPPGQEERKR